MTILLDTEFRELVRHAIPEIIDLLWHREEDVRMASSDALLKLSEHGNLNISYQASDLNVVLFVAEFQESIRVAIPQIITLLRPWNSYICEVGADALVKLSEQGRVSIFCPEHRWRTRSRVSRVD